MRDRVDGERGAVAGLGSGAPVRAELFMDYHCPYSHRVVAWLDELGPGVADVRYRFFALEQVNHDPEAVLWRLWEQPLDYPQYRGRQERRALGSFLATAILEAVEAPGVVRRFRRALYEARFVARADISDLDVLGAAADLAGAAPDMIRRGFADPALVAAARERIAADWAAARDPWQVFGVPTLVIGDAPPVYLRLAAAVPPAGGGALWDALLAFRAAAPGILELKQPPRAPEPAPGE
jgi:hypothetical protein